MRDLPLVCTLQPGELNARAAQFLPGVVAAATARQTIENGFLFTFQASSDVLSSIVRMIADRSRVRRRVAASPRAATVDPVVALREELRDLSCRVLPA